MKLRPYKIQLSRDDVPPEVLGVSRVDYPALLDSLRYPVIWSYDDYLGAWLPSEVYSTEVSTFSEGMLNQANLIEPVGRLPYATLQTNFLNHGFSTVPGLVNREYARGTLSNHFWRQGQHHQRWPEMVGIKRLSINNLPIMRLLHQATESLVRFTTSDKIKTSYSFTSAYDTGSSLPEHVDRPQCIYNISLMLSHSPGTASLSAWPLYIRHAETTNRIDLQVGDAVVYSGTRDPHWRDTMPSSLTNVLGVFFHFVTESFTGSLD